MKNRRFPYKTSRDYRRRLMNVAYLSVGLPMVVFMWLYLELSQGSLYPLLNPPYEYIVITLCSISVFALMWMGYKVFKSGLYLAQDEDELKEKLIIYEKVSERKFIYLLFASLITIAGMYMCATQVFAAIYSLIIIMFSMGNPSTDKIVTDLRLKDKDKNVIMKGDEFNFDY